MLNSEMQHQFWITKKTLQRKIGSKEDDCIISSDALLDTKIELFRAILESSINLHKVIDNLQENICILSQQENSLGNFLKQAGEKSQTSQKVMKISGKVVSYCGQQRMNIRPSLIRLYQEVNIFQCRAIQDTQETIEVMEKSRTKYRAALSWMKSTSLQLDPDSEKGIQKFRKSQNHVRMEKKKFDLYSMDCVQKIDLLAAARCNMFSHALVAYMHSLSQFAEKSSSTLYDILLKMSTNFKYDFSILKELSDHVDAKIDNDCIDGILFFSNDFSDDGSSIKSISQSTFPHTQKLPEDFETTGLHKDETTEDSTAIKKSPSIKSANIEHLDNDLKSKTSWLHLFSELDPISNPDIVLKKINGEPLNSEGA